MNAGAESRVVTQLADCRQYCAEGLGEAEACGDAEMQAQFFVLGSQLNVIEGKSLEHTLSLIEVCQTFQVCCHIMCFEMFVCLSLTKFLNKFHFRTKYSRSHITRCRIT